MIGDHTYEVLDLLTSAECEAIINATENAATHFTPEHIYFGYNYRATDAAVSSRDVMRFSDEALTLTISQRLRAVLPALVPKSGSTRHGQPWTKSRF